jgi:hypothetical protein
MPSVRADGHRPRGHRVAGAEAADVVVRGQGAAKIAVGEEAGERAVVGDDAGRPERAPGHRDDHILERRPGRDAGGLGGGAHRLPDAQPPVASELPAGMKAAEFLRCEVPRLYQCNGEGMALAVGARLFGSASRSTEASSNTSTCDDALPRIPTSGESNWRSNGTSASSSAEAAVVRENDRGVAGRVDGFDEMQEDGRRPGAAQGGDDFARDVPGFADTGEHDLSGMLDDQLDRAGGVEPLGGALQRRGLDGDGGAGGVEPSPRAIIGFP